MKKSIYFLQISAISSKALLKTTDPYKYNDGSELEEELGYYNTFFRKYDAQIGRFTGVDILAESTTGLSPFHFGNNNPVMFNDPTGALSAPGAGRMQKGPDGEYHTGWVNEMLWNDKGFYNWGSGMDLTTGGGGGNYFHATGMSSKSVLSQMNFGDQFGQRENGQWGFWNSYNFNPGDRGYNNADATSNSLAEVSVGGGRKWVSLSPQVNVNIQVFIVNSGVNGLFDVGHTAIQVGETVYGYYPTGNLYLSKGVMQHESRTDFDARYKPQGYTAFTLSISQTQVNSLTNILNGYVANPGMYSIFGQQCTSVSCSSLISAGIPLQSYNANYGYNQSIVSWGKSPDEFRTILGAPVNSSFVTGVTRYP